MYPHSGETLTPICTDIPRIHGSLESAELDHISKAEEDKYSREMLIRYRKRAGKTQDPTIPKTRESNTVKNNKHR